MIIIIKYHSNQQEMDISKWAMQVQDPLLNIKLNFVSRQTNRKLRWKFRITWKFLSVEQKKIMWTQTLFWLNPGSESFRRLRRRLQGNWIALNVGVVSRRRSSGGEEHVGVLEKKKSYRRRSDPIRYLIWKWRVGRQEQGKPSLRSVLEAKLFFFFLIGNNIHFFFFDRRIQYTQTRKIVSWVFLYRFIIYGPLSTHSHPYLEVLLFF